MIYAKLLALIFTVLLDFLTIYFRAVVLPAGLCWTVIFLAGVVAVNVIAVRAARAKRNKQWSEL